MSRAITEKPLVRAIATALSSVAAATLIASPSRAAETHTETTLAEHRLLLWVQSPADAVQELLPAGWQLAEGIVPGSNLLMLFIDGVAAIDAAGEQLPDRQVLALVAWGTNAEGETRLFVVGGAASDPAAAPGFYQVNTLVDAVTFDQTVSRGGDAAMVEQTWAVAGSFGNLTAEVAFSPAPPALAPFELNVYSAANPDLHRIYRGSQAASQVPIAAAEVDLAVEGGLLGQMLDGSHQLIHITYVPFYTRQIYVVTP